MAEHFLLRKFIVVKIVRIILVTTTNPTMKAIIPCRIMIRRKAILHFERLYK